MNITFDVTHCSKDGKVTHSREIQNVDIGTLHQLIKEHSMIIIEPTVDGYELTAYDQ